MLPLFLNLTGRRVVLVGDGAVAAAKRELLLAAGADVRDVPAANFEPCHLDDAWLVVTAADGAVNAAVARAAEERRVFVNAADDPPNATAYLSGVVRRDGVTIAISTEGSAPGLTGLLREALDDVLPDEVGEWVEEAKRQRACWRRDGVPFEARRPLLLEALNKRYGRS
ncbi:MAG TPA: NAD(P)-dependent oxidoreductase [Vicinamibacterales bacterium]|jgi:uroporphyrin-III C-methyltransferase/precorrin-2 dehydrogenase/sirohydrochlorin ferrochelatase